MTAYGTFVRNYQVAASGKVLRDLGNDHIRLIDLDGIPDSKLQFLYNADVVHAGTAHCGAFQLHRLKNRHRVDQSGSGRAPFHIHQLGLPHFIRPFESEGIPWKFGSASKRFAVGNVIIGNHQPV